MIKVVVGNVYTKLLGTLAPEVQTALDLTLSYDIPGAHFSEKFQKGLWDGKKHLYFKYKGQSFYSGLLTVVVYLLREWGIEYKIYDRRDRPQVNLPHLKFDGSSKYFEERPYQALCNQNALKSTRGIIKLATGGGKCLGRGTPVMMYDGNIKSVEDVAVGDLLMGPDSKPRKVLQTSTGFGKLYLVKQNNGMDFVCNDEHILCCEHNHKQHKGEKIEIEAEDFYKSSPSFQHTAKGYKVSVNFEAQDVPLEPYFLGLWLGDGNSRSPSITTGDSEITDYICDFAKRNEVNARIKEEKGNCHTVVLTTKRGLKNPVLSRLQDLDLILNKHIPDIYKRNSRETRLSLLAGLIDSDGNKKRKGSLEYSSKLKSLAEDVCWISRSLGFRSSMNKKVDRSGYVSYRVSISGKIDDIPIQLARKKAGNKTKYLALRYGIKLEENGFGEYFGFVIDGDRKFLLGDFTVTHNTMVVTKLIGDLKVAPFMFYVMSHDLLEQAHETLSACLNEPIGRIGGGECDIKSINVCTIQTAIRSLNIDNAKFNISDYCFDEEDKFWWKTKDIEDLERLEKIRKIIGQAKGVYFDECHHASASTVLSVLTNSPNAYWRFGGSATPYREDNAELLMQSMFGKNIVDINASYLIKKGYLLTPNIFFVPVKHKLKAHSYQKIYSQCINKGEEFNFEVAQLAKWSAAQDLSTLILVQHYAQGDFLKDHLNCEFITGKMTKARRKKAIQDMREKKTKIAIATSLADEGLDLPTLDMALLAGGGASANRTYQRVGRTLRVDKEHPEKSQSVVVSFDHKVKYLHDHSLKVKRILKEEPEFNLIKSKGFDYIQNEIAEKLGLSTSPTLFDV